jgi:uncharacterized protein YxjI
VKNYRIAQKTALRGHGHSSGTLHVSLHHTLVLEGAAGCKLASIKHKLLTVTDAINIEHDGAVVATVHRAVVSPLHWAHIDLAAPENPRSPHRIVFPSPTRSSAG